MPERLPNARRAYINPGKIRDYALNPKHAIGRFKAAFFAQMGYSQENWHMLIQDIQEQHLLADVEAGQPSPFGRKYTITALLQGPLGEARWVTTVWIIRNDQDRPELITIEPATIKRE